MTEYNRYFYRNIIGNENLKKNLRSAALFSRPSHSYIFNAPDGMGKHTAAITFAKSLECENITQSGEPCGKCLSCIGVESDNNPDIIFVSASKKTVGVDDIREKIIKKAGIKNFKYRYKIFIIENADTMTVPAQNALLKTIEEPPENCIFLMLAENYERFLPTVLSRCVLVKLMPIGDTVISSYLRNKCGIDASRADICASFARGNLGKALQLADSQEFISSREYVISLIFELNKADLIGMYETADKFEENKDKTEVYLDMMYLFYRDVLMYKNFGNDSFVTEKDKMTQIRMAADLYDKKDLFRILDAISSAMTSLTQNVNYKMTIENMIFKIKEKRK
ncbi:MAG: DNA polymerase III subunit delta [Firmicutes bacterium]|nr:DNA polymerase III subunit delta [Bacillota bacterium]